MKLYEQFGPDDVELVGVYSEIADKMDEAGLKGHLVALVLAENYGGRKIYMHKPDRMLIPARNRKIVEEFSGANLDQLAEKYNLSVEGVRQIIKADRDARAVKQLSFFENEDD